MLRDLGISGGTLIFCLIMGYFVIKWAVKNAILEAHYAITGEKSKEELEVERFMEEDAKKRQAAKDEYEAKKEARRKEKASRKAAEQQ